MTLALDYKTLQALASGSIKIDLGSPLGRAGLPWGWGSLRLEQNSNLAPVEARGYKGDPGEYWSVRNDPAVSASLGRVVATLAAATWRLERAEVPEWQQDDPAALFAAEMQWVYAQRLWRRWTVPAPGGTARLASWIREALWTVPVAGFGLWEMLGEEGVLEVGGAEVPVWWPHLPSWIAPWAVQYWLTQEERLIGVVFDFSYSTDYGGMPGAHRLLIPSGKLLHVAADKVGSNHEGRSWLRSVAQQVDLNRDSMRIEAVAEQVYGGGEVWVIGDFDETEATRVDEYLINREALHAPGCRLPQGSEVIYGSPGTTMPALTEVIERRNRSIALALGAEDRGIATQGGGSYAAREVAADGSRDENDDRAVQYVCEPLEQVISRFIRASGLDFGRDDLHFGPCVKYGAVETRTPGERVDLLARAKTAGLLVWTPEDERLLRADLDLATGEVASDGSG